MCVKYILNDYKSQEYDISHKLRSYTYLSINEKSLLLVSTLAINANLNIIVQVESHNKAAIKDLTVLNAVNWVISAWNDVKADNGHFSHAPHRFRPNINQM